MSESKARNGGTFYYTIIIRFQHRRNDYGVFNKFIWRIGVSM